MHPSKIRAGAIRGRFAIHKPVIAPASFHKSAGPCSWPRAALLLTVAWLYPLVAAGAELPVRYALDLRSVQTHKVRVEMVVPGAPPSTEIQFPAWNALYQIRDFIRNVEDVRVECDGHSIELNRVDLNTFGAGSERCEALSVRYAVYINEESPFSSVLNDHHAFINLAMVLFYLPKERARRTKVRFQLPEGWKLATLLPDGNSPDEFEAANYDALVDSPVEAGNFDSFEYQQGGAMYRVVVDANPDDYSSSRLLDALKRITASETALMGGAPFSHYTFIYHFLRNTSGGGMEHALGTAISLPVSTVRDNWAFLLSVSAHEFFHAWNVKRIRPAGLEPVDYIHGNDTGSLWFAEGVTSTYQDLTLERSGLISREDFYRRIAFQIGLLQERPARLFQSAEQSGRSAWLEKYLDYLQPERSISYYNKGELLGLLLDLGIRHATGNRSSLDDVMRRLNEEYAKRGRTFTDGDLRNVLAGVAPEFTDLDAFIRDYISGTRELDYDTYFGYAGLRLVVTTAAQGALGFRSAQGFEGPTTVESVAEDSNAAHAGLRQGDVLLSMNGRPLQGLPEQLLGGYKPGSKVEFEVRRGNKTFNLKFNLAESHITSYRLEEITGASDAQVRVRNGWLEGKTQGPIEPAR